MNPIPDHDLFENRLERIRALQHGPNIKTYDPEYVRLLHGPAEAATNFGKMYYVSHSGGKDSQAMYAYLRRIGIPDDQITVVHANLGEVEWPGVIDHIKANIEHELHIVRAGKTFLDMVERRHESRPDVAPWPSPKYRQCTSDLKRGPIEKFIRNHMKANGLKYGVNCMGLRAEESSARAKRATWTQNQGLSKAGRDVTNWLPIHGWKVDRVWHEIKAAGQQPFHAYAKGNARLSCMFCIMGCPGDLQNAAKANPALLEKYLKLEQKTGYTMFPDGSLAERLVSEKPLQGDLF